jgi:hypothetical protein
VTRQVDPLQVTRPWHELRPEQATTLVPALVVMPAPQDRLPLQVRLHWLPEQLTADAQLVSPSHVSSVVEATLVTAPLHAFAPAQVTVHWLPPQRMGPAQASASLVRPQVMSHEEASPQSTPWAQPPAPQVT